VTATWEQRFDPEDRLVHVVPIDDVVMHEFGQYPQDCVCGPKLQSDVPVSDGGVVTMVYHSAADGRPAPGAHQHSLMCYVPKYVTTDASVFAVMVGLATWTACRWTKMIWATFR